MSSRHAVAALSLCQLTLWCAICCAQQADPTAQGVRESRPEVYYTKDKDGNLVPLITWTLEELEEAVRQREGGMPPPRPSYTIQRLSVTGTADTNLARLKVEIAIEGESDNWVPLPLRFAGAVLREPAQFDGPGEFLLEADSKGSEYIAWLRGSGKQPRRCVLQLQVPLDTQADQIHLKLNAPRAAYSELILTVPSPSVTGEVPRTAVLDSVRQVDQTTEFKVLGLTGDFVFAWHKADQPRDAPAALQATGEVVSRIDGTGIRSEAVLKVSSHGGPFDRFRVRLPPGARLLPSEHSDVTVSLEPAAEGATAGESDVVLVSFTQPGSVTATVRLATEQAHSGDPASSPVELAGFEVLGAIRQSGYIAVEVEGDWHVTFGPRHLAWQVAELPDNLRRERLLAGFEYTGQPFSLPVRILPPATSISVEPRYGVLVKADRLELEARLSFHITGAKVFGLEVNLQGWQLQAGGIGPAAQVDADGVASVPGGGLSIPLKQALKGDVELVLRAHQQLDPQSAKVEFSLPRPQATSLGLADLVVQPADNVELVPRDAELVQLSRQSTAPDWGTADWQQEPLAYRADPEQARFVGDLRVKSPTIEVSLDARIRLENGGGTVEQTLLYQVLYEAVGSLPLEVPSSVFDSDQLVVRLDSADGAKLPIRAAPPAQNTDSRRIHVELPEARIGPVKLSIAFPLAPRQRIARASVTLQVPLVTPLGARCVENRLSVTAPSNLRVQKADKKWTADPDGPPDEFPGTELTLTSPTPKSKIDLAVRWEDRGAGESVVVDRAWIQTWFDEYKRTDRAVFRFSSRTGGLRVRLPPGVIAPRFWLDRREIAPRPRRGQANSEEWLIAPEMKKSALTPKTLGDDGLVSDGHVLDIRYSLAERGPRYGRFQIVLPSVAQDADVRHTYWQIVFPGDEHLLAGPSGLASESSWVFNGWYWGRRPILDESQLEQWSGGAQDAPLPRGTNRYLFSAARLDGSQSVQSAQRPMLVAIASGGVLIAGLLFIYVPILRHPSLLLIGGVVVLGTGVVAPEATLLGLQAAAVGFALVGLSAALESRISRRRQRGSPRSPSSSVVRVGSTRTQLRPPPSAVSPSTQSAAVSLEVAEERVS